MNVQCLYSDLKRLQQYLEYPICGVCMRERERERERERVSLLTVVHTIKHI